MRNIFQKNISPRTNRFDDLPSDVLWYLLRCRDGVGADLAEVNGKVDDPGYTGTGSTLWNDAEGVTPDGDGLWSIPSNALLRSIYDFTYDRYIIMSFGLKFVANGFATNDGNEWIFHIGDAFGNSGGVGQGGFGIQLFDFGSANQIKFRAVSRETGGTNTAELLWNSALSDGTHYQCALCLSIANNPNSIGGFFYINGALAGTPEWDGGQLDGSERIKMVESTPLVIGGRYANGALSESAYLNTTTASVLSDLFAMSNPRWTEAQAKRVAKFLSITRCEFHPLMGV